MSNGTSSIKVPLKQALKSKKGLGKRQYSSSEGEEDDFGHNIEIFTEESPVPKTICTTKKLHITESKILGTALPRKPRIGPDYQANLPALPTKKIAEAKQP